jgi:hypothetical protein
MANMTNCPACGMVTDPQLGTCVHCGRAFPQKATPLQRKKKESSDTCPNCGAMVRSSEVICITCNTNLVTGKIIPADSGVHTASVKPQTKRIALFVGIGVLILLLAAAVWVLT